MWESRETGNLYIRFDEGVGGNPPLYSTVSVVKKIIYHRGTEAQRRGIRSSRESIAAKRETLNPFPALCGKIFY